MKRFSQIFFPGQGAGNFPKYLESMIRKEDRPPLRVTLEEYKPAKTQAQRDYYHSVVLREIANRMEADYYVVKEKLRQLFVAPKEVFFDGRHEYLIPSTEQLTREEYSELIEACLAFAAERCWYIPGPYEHDNR